MTKLPPIIAALVTLAGPVPASAASAGQDAAVASDVEATDAERDAAIHGTFNNGEDVTRPINQLQVRQRYTRLPDDDGLQPEKWTTTLRADLRADLGAGWQIYGRIDQPLIYANDVTSPFNPNGHGRFGAGDLLTEAAIILPAFTPRLGSGVGVRAIWPIAGLNETGKGKYQVGPVVAFRYSLPEISPGSFFLPQVLYQNSVASRDHNSRRTDVNVLNIQPKLNFALPGDWFITAFATENIEINYNDDGKLFIPFDLMVGKKLFDNLVASLEYSRSLFHNQGFEPYQWQLEGRLGYSF